MEACLFDTGITRLRSCSSTIRTRNSTMECMIYKARVESTTKFTLQCIAETQNFTSSSYPETFFVKKPKIVTRLHSGDVGLAPNGNNVQFNCTYDTTENVSYKWKVTVEAANSNHLAENISNLNDLVKDVKSNVITLNIGFSGNFNLYCSAVYSKTLAEIQSKGMWVRGVGVKIQVFSMYPSKGFKIGERMNMECRVKNGIVIEESIKMKWMWYRNGIKMDTSPETKIFDEDSKGEYHCEYISAMYRIISKPIQIEKVPSCTDETHCHFRKRDSCYENGELVHRCPTKCGVLCNDDHEKVEVRVEKWTNNNAELGESYALRCDAGIQLAKASLTYTWKKNGVVIPHRNKAVLKWSSLKLEDIGEYKCKIQLNLKNIESLPVHLTTSCSSQPKHCQESCRKGIPIDGEISTSLNGLQVKVCDCKISTLSNISVCWEHVYQHEESILKIDLQQDLATKKANVTCVYTGIPLLAKSLTIQTGSREHKKELNSSIQNFTYIFPTNKSMSPGPFQCILNLTIKTIETKKANWLIGSKVESHSILMIGAQFETMLMVYTALLIGN